MLLKLLIADENVQFWSMYKVWFIIDAGIVYRLGDAILYERAASSFGTFLGFK